MSVGSHLQAMHVVIVQAKAAEEAREAKELKKKVEKLEKELKRLEMEKVSMAQLEARWDKYTRHAHSYSTWQLPLYSLMWHFMISDYISLLAVKHA